MKMKKLLCYGVAVIFSIILLTPQNGFAADQNWTGGSVVDGKWSTVGNWSGGAAPGSTAVTTNTDTATFNAAIVNTWGLVGTPVVIDNAAQNIKNLTFTLATGNYYVGATGGNSLRLTTGGTIQIDSSLTATNASINVLAPLSIYGAAYTITNNSSSTAGAGCGTLNIGGGITGAAAGADVLTINGSNTTANTISGIITKGTATSMAVTKDGLGTWILSGNNGYTGATTVSAGTLKAGFVTTAFGVGSAVTVASGATLDLAGFAETIGSLAGSGNVTNSGGSNKALTVGDATSSTTFSGTISDGSTNKTLLTKAGASTLTLDGINTYTGDTALTAGILNINNARALGVGGTLIISDGVTIDNTSGAAITNANVNPITMNGSLIFTGHNDLNSGTGAMTLGGNGTCTVNGSTLTIGGVIDDGANTYTIEKAGTGTLVFNGANTYGGLTTISKGILRAGSTTALGITGGVTVADDATATLDVGAYTLNIGSGIYTQSGAGSLKVAVNSPSTSGQVSSTVAAAVAATSTVAVTVTNNVYIPTNATFKIVDGISTGSTVSVPGTITSSNSRVKFSGSSSSGDLTLTASRSGIGFASLATNSNASAAGNALDNVLSPSSDMTNGLNTLNGLSNSQTAAALDTVTPIVDAGVLNTTTSSLNNFVGVAMERTENILKLAQNRSTSAATGLSAGDEEMLNGIWEKGYGSYLNQDTRKDIQGYNAWNAGTALGIDRLLTENITLGISGGYAYGNVDSDANNGNTYINSGQGTIYGGYQFSDIPVFIDAAGTFAWNWYNGRRDITVGTISRRANAAYDGQQYGAYLGGGYRFDAGHNLFLTPLASLNYMHLHLGSYTETEAGALSLTVASQDYDFLQSGLGARAEYPLKLDCGTLTPAVHGKWLYDFIGDNVQATSTFTGGGASFDTNGADPAQSSFDVGGTLSLALKNDVTITGECDTELKDEFWGIYGSVTMRYNF